MFFQILPVAIFRSENITIEKLVVGTDVDLEMLLLKKIKIENHCVFMILRVLGPIWTHPDLGPSVCEAMWRKTSWSNALWLHSLRNNICRKRNNKRESSLWWAGYSMNISITCGFGLYSNFGSTNYIYFSFYSNFGPSNYIDLGVHSNFGFGCHSNVGSNIYINLGLYINFGSSNYIHFC